MSERRGEFADAYYAARRAYAADRDLEHPIEATGETLRARWLEELEAIRAREAEEAACEIVLPSDAVVARALEEGAPSETVAVDACPPDAMILDVGPRTIERIATVFEGARTLIWNGPLGAFEVPPFDAATRAAAQKAAELTREGHLVSVAGGGDTVAALRQAGVVDDFSYVSTAGGAFLEWMEGKTLPGVAALDDDNHLLAGAMRVCEKTALLYALPPYAGLVAVDETTIDYLQGRPFAPKGDLWEQAVGYWRGLQSDADAAFDKVVVLKGEEIQPQVSWGTSPEMVAPVGGQVPAPESFSEPVKQKACARALQYMGLEPGQAISDIRLDRVFIGSCTNARIEDLRAAAAVVNGKKVAPTLKQALVVPGSGQVKAQAEAEGLDKIFIEAGMEWRAPSCSMCLAMNSDKLGPGEHCASTSNRNFEGRQGYGGRTHLVSPQMAAAAAIAGHFVDVRDWL